MLQTSKSSLELSISALVRADRQLLPGLEDYDRLRGRESGVHLPATAQLSFPHSSDHGGGATLGTAHPLHLPAGSRRQAAHCHTQVWQLQAGHPTVYTTVARQTA